MAQSGQQQTPDGRIRAADAASSVRVRGGIDIDVP